MNDARPLILIADDDPDLRRMVRLHLEELPVDLLEASDGLSTLETILTELPNLVILDVMMPGYTGWEVLRYLRNKPRVRKIPELANVGVIMLTGIGETLNELSSPMYGADDYIDKPFKARDLLAKIKTVLEKKGFEIPDLDD